MKIPPVPKRAKPVSLRRSQIDTITDVDKLKVAATKADRYNTGKRQWGLVHYKSLEPMVEVLEYGAKKYSANNWRKGLDKKEILESMMRHLAALMDGEINCSESNLSHVGHIQCNAMFYNYFHQQQQDELKSQAAIKKAMSAKF